MGVRGLTGILAEASTQDGTHVSTPIPAGSILAMDGPGLCYYIHDQAYRSFYNEILRCTDASLSKTAIITALLPSKLPLDLIAATCQSLLHEWVHTAGLHLSIYFDSTTMQSPFKKATLAQRQKQREEEEARLQDFLLYSSIPASWYESSRGRVEKAPPSPWPVPSADEFLSTFPRSTTRLWFHQIKRDIQEFKRDHVDQVSTIECPDEADVYVAFHAADDVSGNTFAVGGDSDYFIFGGDSTQFGQIQYIPFDSLKWKDGILEGRVWTRSSVMDILGLPDEASLIEYSLLLGNDFTKPYLRGLKELETSTDLFSGSDKTAIDSSRLALKDQIRLELIRKGPGYRVTSTHTELDQAIQYSRDFYTFQDLSKYSLLTVDGDDAGYSDIENLVERMGLDSFPVDCARFQPADSIFAQIARHVTLRHQILRPFQQYYQSQTCGYIPNESEEESDDLKGPSAVRRFLLSHWTDYMKALEESLFTETIFDSASSQDSSRAFTNINANLLVTSQLNWYDHCMMTLIEMLIHIAVTSSVDKNADADKRRAQGHSSNISLSYKGIFNKHRFLTIMMGLRQESMAVQSKNDEPVIQPEMVYATLPIDEHKDTILKAIQNQRVTIIQGETGCGKSTRVPVMILKSPPPDCSMKRVKMFITQPRRIAAKALVEHVRASEPMLRDKFALRLGHGVREYESESAQAWFCTTGYLVRYLARYPEMFKRVTHLIIDEVHERSVETDLLCLLTKRLLSTYPHLRLILMSATIAAEIYTEYFDVSHSPICVSARRFPIREYYLEDLPQVLSLGPKEKSLIGELVAKSGKHKGPVVPSSSEVEQLHDLAVYLTKAIGSHGSSVLIFVSGMMDIVSISELIEKIKIPGITFNRLPIHSDVPIEDQLVVFQPPGPNEVKVIIATNAAESSITLPDIDRKFPRNFWIE